MTTFHKAIGTWQKLVDRYIALSHFSAEKFVVGGLPADKIVVKPNFISPDPGPGRGAGHYALFVGRLVPEKGIETLLEAWDQLGGTLPLKIIGDGPLADHVQDRAARNKRIEYLGRKSGAEVLQFLGDATCLVMPSEWYECCPKTLIETMAVGTPAVVSRLGAMAEMVQHEATGLNFEAGNAEDLTIQIKRLAGDSLLSNSLRQGARNRFTELYTAEANYQMLLDIYQQARMQRGCNLIHDKSLQRQMTASVVAKPAHRVSS